jgi:hypothetical protein
VGCGVKALEKPQPLEAAYHRPAISRLSSLQALVAPFVFPFTGPKTMDQSLYTFFNFLINHELNICSAAFGSRKVSIGI